MIHFLPGHGTVGGVICKRPAVPKWPAPAVQAPRARAQQTGQPEAVTNMLSTLNFDLGEDIEQLREATREFAEREIAPLAVAADRNNEFPSALWTKLGEMGLL